MYNFSPNMLKTYETCPKKFFYRYVENLSVPMSSIPFEKGKKIHALANYYLLGVNISRIETSLTESEREVWNLLLDNLYFKKDCLKSEFQLNCKVDKFWIGGRLDAVVRDFENYYILDYKTGAIPKNPMYDFQTMIYLLCLDRYLGVYDSLSFVYIDLKEGKNQIINFNKDLKDLYETKVVEGCQKISDDNSYHQNCKNCEFCEYLKICNLKNI